MDSPAEKLSTQLATCQRLIHELEGLKLRGTVKWAQLATELRAAARDLEEVAEAARVWK